MEIKNITIEDLKKDYSSRHGFIFQGAAACDQRNCEKVASAVKSNSYTDSMPEFVGVLNERTFAFVYPEDSFFECGSFFKETRHMCMMLNAFNIDILTAFLNEN
jgi:hypothetical protein